MNKYIVTYSHSIIVEAEDRKNAVSKADEIWDEITPRKDEMSIEVKLYKEEK